VTVTYRRDGEGSFSSTSFEGVSLDRPWGDIDEAVVYAIRTAVSDKLSTRQAGRAGDGLPRLARADEEQLVAQLASEELRDHARRQLERGRKPPSQGDEQAILKAVLDLLFGMGRLQPYLDRPDVKNIHAQGARPGWLELLDGTSTRGAPCGGELVDQHSAKAGSCPGPQTRYDPATHDRTPPPRR
jgi:hypothetical protein